MPTDICITVIKHILNSKWYITCLSFSSAGDADEGPGDGGSGELIDDTDGLAGTDDGADAPTDSD